MELIDNEKDKALWRIAKNRASFKTGLLMYIVINAFLWCVWYFTSGPNSYPWPVWSMLGWGLGVVLQYFRAYHMDKGDLADQEYEKLKRERQGQSK